MSFIFFCNPKRNSKIIESNFNNATTDIFLIRILENSLMTKLGLLSNEHYYNVDMRNL